MDPGHGGESSGELIFSYYCCIGENKQKSELYSKLVAASFQVETGKCLAFRCLIAFTVLLVSSNCLCSWHPTYGDFLSPDWTTVATFSCPVCVCA